jgi:hypothetical protein
MIGCAGCLMLLPPWHRHVRPLVSSRSASGKVGLVESVRSGNPLISRQSRRPTRQCRLSFAFRCRSVSRSPDGRGSLRQRATRHVSSNGWIKYHGPDPRRRVRQALSVLGADRSLWQRLVILSTRLGETVSRSSPPHSTRSAPQKRYRRRSSTATSTACSRRVDRTRSKSFVQGPSGAPYLLIAAARASSSDEADAIES